MGLIENRKSKIENRKSKIENRTSKIENRFQSKGCCKCFGRSVLRKLPKPTAAPDFNPISKEILTDAEERYLGAVFPAGFAVPEFDGFDHAAIAGKIDRAGRAAGRNAIANDEFFMRALLERTATLLEK